VSVLAGRSGEIGAIIHRLNSIHIGEASAIATKLEAAASDLRRLGETEIEAVIHQAASEFGRADLVNFRRLVAQAVAKLGHLR
jgi:hypothetical protein